MIAKSNSYLCILAFLLVAGTFSENVLITSSADLTNEKRGLLRAGDLEALNVYRALHGGAALELDEGLNSLAQAQAENIFNLQDPEDKSEGHGVDYWESTFYKFELDQFEYEAGNIIEAWYSQKSNYDFATGQKIKEDELVDDFTAMLWKGVTKIGIGYAAGVEDIGIQGVGFYAVVMFSPLPNVEGQYVDNLQPELEIEAAPQEEPILFSEGSNGGPASEGNGGEQNGEQGGQIGDPTTGNPEQAGENGQPSNNPGSQLTNNGA